MLSPNDKIDPGRTLSNAACLVQRHSTTVRRNAEKLRKNRVLGPNDDSATEGVPLSHLLFAISPDLFKRLFL